MTCCKFDVDFTDDNQFDVTLRDNDNFNVNFAGSGGTLDYEDLIHKPRINGVELIGNVVITGGVSDVEVNGESAVNEQGVAEITIPPVVNDLGNIDTSEYEDDIEVFLNTLLQDGAYRFVWEDGDDFEYYVVVESMLDNGYVYQRYWYSEEGSKYLYNCSLTVEDGVVVDRYEDNYMTTNEAILLFAPKNHSHYESKSMAKTVWDYCDDDLAFDNGKPYIIYADTLNSKNWLIERYSAMRSPNQRFLRLYDLGDASHFFMRSGTYSNGVITWGSWKEYPSGGGGMNITVNGTSYPITAITSTTVSGVSGVLVDYDDGNSGQLFFADGAGLNTVKTVIEGGIPHDTSELTNGAGFLTISDLPIYNGGVS